MSETTTITETEAPEVPTEAELELARQTAVGLGELWNSLYDWRKAIAPEDEGGYHLNSTVRAITKALDSVSEAQEHLSAEIVSIQKELGRAK